MRISRGLESFRADARPSVVALGSFDGVHLAHQKILALAVERARALSITSVACTFDPHPLQVLQPDRAPFPITTLDERLELIAACGVEETVVVPFTSELSRVEADVFIKDVLLDALRAREVVVGFNHTFGRGARGDARLLETLGPSLGFTARVVPPLTIDGTAVSSSAIRESLRAGDVVQARRFLGRPYSLRGAVLRGAGRGRQLGFPTANLRPERPIVLATGVYAAHARVLRAGTDPQPALPSVVNVGYRPTFDNEYWIEAYLLDFEGDLYSATLELAFVARLRDERKFPGIEALKSQIAQDVESARQAL
jgi:riboflavin kinase/FMN adenylyltransferase